MAMLRGVNGLPSLVRGFSDCCQGQSGGKGGRVLTLETMNQNIVKMQYEGGKKATKKLTVATLGDPQAMGQKPITFIRQTMACCAYPPLIEDSSIPEDVKEKARLLLKNCGGSSVGSYTQSPGIEVIRENVAKYIAARDGHPARAQDVVLQSGASNAIKTIIALFEHDEGKPFGAMIPVPQYPLYSATNAESGLVDVPYFLDEEKNWGVSVEELKRALEEGKKICDVSIIVVTNPGNPTGQVMSKKEIEDVIKFAHQNRLFIFANEVYQLNTYGEHKFCSFKKVLCELGEPYVSSQEMASFMSLSKGYMGECGVRAGWTEILNMDEDVLAHHHKALSAMLCSSALGQIGIDCMVCPPKEGDPSYELWFSQKEAVLQSLAQRARMVTEAFACGEGIKCNEVQGAMYAFPRITIPQKAIEAAGKENIAPDAFYTHRLHEDAGICVKPGCLYGQKQGTHHFRTTILPPPDQLKAMLENIKKFHAKFTSEFS